MKFPLIIILIVTNSFLLKAQHLSNGIVFSGSGTQQAIHTAIDKIGNQYVAVWYDGNFTIDSVGTPVSILHKPNPTPNRKSLAILKYDSTGRYLYNLRFYSLHIPFSSRISINFDSNNNLYFFFSTWFGDTVECMDPTNGTHFLFNKVRPGISHLNWLSYHLCKITDNGLLTWNNTISYPDSLNPPLLGKLLNINTCQTSVNTTGEITVHVLHALPQNNLADTLHITHGSGLETIMTVTTEDVIIKFSTTGNLIYGVEPFKNKLKSHTDPVTNRIYKSVTDGRYSYSINRFYLSSDDTFRCRTPVPMAIGQNFLLIKSDDHDSIVWAKFIGRGDAYSFVLDYNNHTQEIALGFTCLPYDFISPYNPNYSSTHYYDILLAKMDTSGTVKWTKMYQGNNIDALVALTYNQKTNQLIAIGSTESSNLQLDAFSIPKIATSTAFVAVMDSTNTISFAQPIRSSSFDLLRATNTLLGAPLTDKNGRTFIPGWFNDSIILHCKMLKSTTSTTDGVLLTFNTIIPKDTGVCRRMTSPSGKYIWDSLGVYFDTIPNHKGCDSVLLFRLTILQTKSVIDTSVCYSLKSPSGRYVWDSSGIYKDTIPNSKGCDSILAVRVKVLHSQSFVDTGVCSSLRSPSGKYRFQSSGTYYDTIPNYINCDSIIKISLTILQSGSLIDTSNCSMYISPSGKLYISQTGIYDDTIPNTNGCDSIITIRFTKTNLKDTISISDCKSYQSPSGKYIFSLSGQYTDTLQSVFNCDSILFINYVRLSTQSLITRTICDTLLSPSGKYVYSASGFYQDTVTSYLGCDSVITINLIVKPIQLTVSKSNDISCDSLFSTLQATTGYSYVWSPQNTLNDVTISNPRATPSTNTIYYVIVSDSLGCTKMDSVEVFVNKEETIEQLSNVFTPNDDGINDCLMLKGVGELKQVDLTIYNRWGARVFSTNKPDDCWDGRINDQEAPAGTYFFILNGVSICETLISQHGSVQLIR